jgi:DNA-binding CsgD family transcriptional regulator
MTFQESYPFFAVENMNYIMSRVLNKINAFICIIDIENLKIIWANRYFINKMGVSSTVLLNMTADELLLYIHPDYREIAIDGFRNSENNDSNSPYGLFKVRIKCDNWIWVLTTCISFEKNCQGQTSKILTFATEVDICQLYKQISTINNKDKATNAAGLIKLLSEREKTVIELITDGYSDKRVSAFLGISIHTAKTHRKRIIHKMGLRNSSALIKYAVENGLYKNVSPA